jgi:transcriptional regulator with XRE-family HTH domain
MSAKAATVSFCQPLGRHSFCTWQAMPLPPRRPSNDADAVRSVLSSCGLSLAEISRQSRSRFSRNRLFYVPPNFYDALRHASFSPSAQQLYVLSVLTGYRLADWMSIFGFSFDDAAAFQAAWPRNYTTELDSRVYDRTAEVGWFREPGPVTLGTALTPLSRWLAGKTIRPLDSLAAKADASFRYLKIGARDAYAYPDLLPGSVVRVNNHTPTDPMLPPDKANSIWAVGCYGRILCARIRPLRHRRIVLCSRQLAYEPLELELGTEAKVLGYVDLEIRRLESRELPEVQPCRKALEMHPSSKPGMGSNRIGEFVRRARLGSGLSFRETSERTAEIARLLKNPAYFCAAGTLSDLEARDRLPRHVHKLISLSAVYCLSLLKLAELAGFPLDKAGQNAMPAHPIHRTRHESTEAASPHSPFLTAVEKELEEIPFFLRKALPSMVGLPDLSVRDLFWAGTTEELVHPYMQGAVFLAVNRKNKSPVGSPVSPVWAQPLYLLERRDGRRLCAACSVENGMLAVRPSTKTSGGLLRLRHHIDVEVLGKVVAIARRLES